MKIEKYYDVGCYECGRHRSTDFSKGMEFGVKAAVVKKLARSEGWCEDNDGNAICPICAKEKGLIK